MAPDFAGRATLYAGMIVAAEPTPFQRLDGQTRLKLYAALLGFLILGFLLMVLAWLGARLTRRYMHRGEHHAEAGRAKPLVYEDDWARKPLNPGDDL